MQKKSSESNENKFQQALAFHQQGQWQQAETLYQAILQNQPQHVDALHLLGVLAYQCGQAQIAIDLISQSISINPNNAAAHSNRGLAFQALNRFEEALASFDIALDLAPDYVDALSNRGAALNSLKRYHEALASYDRALKIKPDYLQALSNRGNVLHELKRYDEALASYDRALNIKPDYVQALSDRGVVLNSLKRYDEALASYNLALQIKPDYLQALSNRGNVLNELKRYDEALASYDLALSINPDYAEALSNCGLTLNSLKRYEQALACYERALQIKPDYAEAFFNRGNLLSDLKRSHEALSSYDLALHIKPDYVEALSNRGNVLRELKRYDEALASYELALRIQPDCAEILANRGLALNDLKRYEEALACYDYVLRVQPDFAEVFCNRGNVLKEFKRYDEAIASYQSAISFKPDFVIAYCNLLNLLKDQGHNLKAKATLKNALIIAPDSLELHFIQLMMSLPIVQNTAIESALVPSQFDDALTDLSNWLASSENHQQKLAQTQPLPLPFLLAYQAGNHVQRLSRYGDLVANCAELKKTVKKPQKKIRLVVISHHFRRHSVWDVITRGFLVNLDRARFELILYHLGSIEDSETTFAKSLADVWRDTHSMTDITEWLTALTGDTADVIFYPEIGMDPMSARLAAHRLAPLQIASWGHPITTGLPCIDVYFSGELLEAIDADSHYRERLIRLPGTGCCTLPTNIKPEPLLPELAAELTARQGVRFVIAQTVYKFAPADDALYARIASAVGDSTFILLRDPNNAWVTDQIVARVEQAFIDQGLNPKQHLLVIAWQSMGRFQSLLKMCDVYLDCPAFSGYTTAWQAVQHGLPIVTLEGEFMRQRLAAGLLRKMGITDTIASSREEYVQLAVKLAKECRNPTSRNTRRHTLKTSASKADNNLSVVRAFEQTVIAELARLSHKK